MKAAVDAVKCRSDSVGIDDIGFEKLRCRRDVATVAAGQVVKHPDGVPVIKQ